MSGLKSEVLKQNSIYDGSILPVVSQNSVSKTCLDLLLRSEDALQGGNTLQKCYRHFPQRSSFKKLNKSRWEEKVMGIKSTSSSRIRCDQSLLLVACWAFLMFCSKLINKQGTISQTEIWQKAVSLDQLMSGKKISYNNDTPFKRSFSMCSLRF